MTCGWEGNRRSGVTLAMRHRLKWFIHPLTHGLDREMGTPPSLSCGVRPRLPLPFTLVAVAEGPRDAVCRSKPCHLLRNYTKTAAVKACDG